MHKCIMVKIYRWEAKNKLGKKRKLNENSGEMYKFCGNRENLYFFNMGEYAICIVGLGDGGP